MLRASCFERLHSFYLFSSSGADAGSSFFTYFTAAGFGSCHVGDGFLSLGFPKRFQAHHALPEGRLPWRLRFPIVVLPLLGALIATILPIAATWLLD